MLPVLSEPPRDRLLSETLAWEKYPALPPSLFSLGAPPPLEYNRTGCAAHTLAPPTLTLRPEKKSASREKEWRKRGMATGWGERRRLERHPLLPPAAAGRSSSSSCSTRSSIPRLRPPPERKGGGLHDWGGLPLHTGTVHFH